MAANDHTRRFAGAGIAVNHATIWLTGHRKAGSSLWSIEMRAGRTVTSA